MYSKYIRRARDIKDYAKFKEIIQDIETKWHYLVSVKVECVKPLPDPLTLDFTEKGKKYSVFKAGKSKIGDHLKKFHDTKGEGRRFDLSPDSFWNRSRPNSCGLLDSITNPANNPAWTVLNTKFERLGTIS